MRDRNIIIQTKELMYVLDKNIRKVIEEGPGSQRDLSPLEISRGQLFIDLDIDNKIKWNLETKELLSEPGIPIQEGTITMLLEETNMKELYLVSLELDYKDVANINLESSYGNPFTGKYGLFIKNTGEYTNNLPKIAIKIT